MKMNLVVVWFVAAMLLCGVTTPMVSYAAPSVPSTEEQYRATLLKLIAALEKQIALLQTQLALQQGETVVRGGILSASVDILTQYQTNSLRDVAAIPNVERRAYFKRLAELTPPFLADRFSAVAVFSSANTEYDAFVETIPPNHDKWLYAVREALLTDVHSDWNTELIVHELAHVIAVDAVPQLATRDWYECTNETQVIYCPPADSYLGQFSNTFWNEGMLARIAQVGGEDYYRAHSEMFVSAYAATAPAEDFAESFMFYVLDGEVTSAAMQAKVDFFAQYPVFSLVRAHVAAVR